MEKKENFEVIELIEYISQYTSLLAKSNEETSVKKKTALQSQLSLLFELIHTKCSKLAKKQPENPTLPILKKKLSCLPPPSSSHPSHPPPPLSSHHPPSSSPPLSPKLHHLPHSSRSPPPSSHTPPPPDSSIRDSSGQEQDFLPEMLPYNSTEITELSSEISAIKALSGEISHMVFEQSENLDQIEVHTLDTLTKVEQGKLELVTAAEETIKRRKNKIKMFFMTLGGLIGIKGGAVGVGVGTVAGGALGGGVSMGLNPMKKQVERMRK